MSTVIDKSKLKKYHCQFEKQKMRSYLKSHPFDYPLDLLSNFFVHLYFFFMSYVFIMFCAYFSGRSIELLLVDRYLLIYTIFVV